MLRRYPITGKEKFLDFEGKAYRLKCPSSDSSSKSVALFLQYFGSYRKVQFKDSILVFVWCRETPQGALHPFFNPIKGPKNVFKLKLDGMENNFDERRRRWEEANSSKRSALRYHVHPHPNRIPTSCVASWLLSSIYSPGFYATQSPPSLQPVVFRRNMKGASGKMCGLVVVGNNFQMSSEV